MDRGKPGWKQMKMKEVPNQANGPWQITWMETRDENQGGSQPSKWTVAKKNHGRGSWFGTPSIPNPAWDWRWRGFPTNGPLPQKITDGILGSEPPPYPIPLGIGDGGGSQPSKWTVAPKNHGRDSWFGTPSIPNPAWDWRWRGFPSKWTVAPKNHGRDSWFGTPSIPNPARDWGWRGFPTKQMDRCPKKSRTGLLVRNPLHTQSRSGLGMEGVSQPSKWTVAPKNHGRDSWFGTPSIPNPARDWGWRGLANQEPPPST